MKNYRYSCLPRQELREGQLSLLTVQPCHVERIREWRNAQKDVLRQTAEITAEQQAAYFSSHIWPELPSPEPNNILLVYLDDDVPIGYGGLVHIAWWHRRAEISFLLDPGFTQDNERYAELFATFLRLMRVLAFDGLMLDRLFTETYAIREHHMAILEGCGFQREGVLRQHVRIDGRPVDSVLHGIVRMQEG